MYKYLKYKQKYNSLRGGSNAYTIENLRSSLSEFGVELEEKSLRRLFEGSSSLDGAINYYFSNDIIFKTLQPTADSALVERAISPEENLFNTIKTLLTSLCRVHTDEVIHSIIEHSRSDDPHEIIPYYVTNIEKYPIPRIVKELPKDDRFSAGNEYDFQEYIRSYGPESKEYKCSTFIPEETLIYIARGNGLCFFNCIFHRLGYNPFKMKDDQYEEFLKSTFRKAATIYSISNRSPEIGLYIISDITMDINTSNRKEMENILEVLVTANDFDSRISLLLCDLYDINIITIKPMQKEAPYIIYTPSTGSISNKNIIIYCLGNHFNLLILDLEREIILLRHLQTMECPLFARDLNLILTRMI